MISCVMLLHHIDLSNMGPLSLFYRQKSREMREYQVTSQLPWVKTPVGLEHIVGASVFEIMCCCLIHIIVSITKYDD